MSERIMVPALVRQRATAVGLEGLRWLDGLGDLILALGIYSVHGYRALAPADRQEQEPGRKLLQVAEAWARA